MKRCFEQEMPGALAAFAHESGTNGIENNHGFRRQRPAFGGAERQHVDAGPPSHLRRTGIEANERIGETRAVYMDGKPTFVRDLGQRGDLAGAVDGAGFAGLGDRERRRHHLMRTMAAIAGQRRLQRRRSDFVAVAGQADELEAMAEELRRAAFIGGDVGFGMTEHDAPGRRNLRQRQRIRRRPGRHQEDARPRARRLRESLRSAACVQSSLP